MKKFGFIFMVMAALCGFLASCDEMQDVREAEQGGLTLTVLSGAPATKAAPDVLDYENSLNSLDLFVFEGGTTRYFYERLVPNGTPSDATRLEYSFNATSGTISATVKKLPVGTYSLVLVANVPAEKVASLTSISAIEAESINLANCSTTASSGFVMYAKKTGIEVSGGTTTTVSEQIQLERFASRVRLVSVTNSIPASAAYANSNQVIVNGIFLSNVASAWTIGTASAANTATNVRGKQSNANITPSTEVVYPVTLHKPVTAAEIAASEVARGATSQLNWNVYGFETKAVLSGATEPKLVVCATVNGTMYYYPVFLIQGTPYPARTGIERNKTYNIMLNISGTGSTDPDTRVERGAFSATVAVKDWVSGAEYTENI